MRFVLPGLIRKILKLNIVKSIILTDKLQTTRQREADCVLKVLDIHGKWYVLHIEFQSSDDAKMAWRMAGYRLMLSEIHQLLVRQYVIHLGEEKSTMPCSITEPGFSFEYTLISLRDFPYQVFLASDNPEERLLAVLADFGKDKPEEVITKVLQSVEKAESDGLEGNKYFEQLRILVQLRNLAKQFNIAMLKTSTFFKEERDPLYQKGEAKGLQKGAQNKGFEVVKNMLLSGRLTVAEIAVFAGVSEDVVHSIKAENNL